MKASSKPDNLRMQMRARREALDPHQVASRSQGVVENLLQLPDFKHSRRVAGYVAVNGETDPHTALQTARAEGKETFVPVICNNILEFAKVNRNTCWRTGKFGIPVPEYDKSECLDAQAMDIVIVPLLAFDASLNRIGMGGGYYDRTFGFRKHQSAPPFLIAIAYEFQKTDNLAMQPWDVPMDKVVTELGVYS